MSELTKKSPWELFKGHLFDDVPEKTAPQQGSPPQQPAPRAFPTTPVVTASPVVGVDERALSRLEEVLRKATPKSYADFAEQYNRLSSIIPDEATRFKAALATSGANPDELALALVECLRALEGARQEFMTRFEGQRSTHDTAMRSFLEGTNNAIDAKRAQIENLQREIGTLESQRNQQLVEFEAKRQSIDRLGQGFEGAYQQVAGRLAAQQTRIAALGKGVGQ